jgi:hypothetical protein
LLAARDLGRVRRPGARLPIRLQAALTAFAFVVSSLIGLVHEATTKHVRCAEHGELMHGDPAQPTRTATVAPRRDSVVRDVAATTPHRHEHCSLTSTTRDSRVELRGPVVAPAPLAISDVAGAAPRAAALPGDSLYRTAPKTSPPA